MRSFPLSAHTDSIDLTQRVRRENLNRDSHLAPD